MAVSPALVKAAIAAATDKRTWIAVGSIVVGIIFGIVAVVGAFLNMFTFDDTGAADAQPAYVEFITNMRDCYSKLDASAEAVCSSLDKDYIHAVFYTMYFGEDKTLPDSFYTDFVNCFVSRSTTDGVETVVPADKSTTFSRLETLTGKTLPEAYRTQIDELYTVLKFGAGMSGYDTSTEDIGGAPAEAYSDAKFAQLMKEATKYIGYPYVWGGYSPSTSFDCSGFVCWAYTKSGVHNLPRTTAHVIYNQCSKISASEAKPGDLVFFTRTYVSSETITHVGIYVGGGKMLHCGNPIKYASITTDYWKSHFYGFGRLQ